MTIAVLGLGRMGRAMAARLLETGQDVTVWNRSDGRAGELVAAGARAAATVAEAVRDANVIIIMVFGPEAARAVLADVGAAAPAASLVVNTSTVGPAVARELGEACAKAGLSYVDGPVLGTVGPAREGRLRLLLGGEPAHTAAAAAALEALGRPEVVGGVGAASAVKIVYNQSLALAVGALGEALRLGVDQGIEVTALLDALAEGPLGFVVGYKGAQLRGGEYQPAAFTTAGILKDIRLALDAAERELPMTAALAGVAEAVAAARPEDDFAAIAGTLATGA
jgi:3-hydroxyisobutyrate dehydrogenase